MLPDMSQLTALLKAVALQELLPRFEKTGYQVKQDDSLITEADLAVQEAIGLQLKQHWPDFSLLGEEMEIDEQQSLLTNNQDGLWILDPLDGTINFSSHIPFFSISLALLQNGEITAGLVFDPVRDECFMAIKGQGAWLNNQPLSLESFESVTDIVTAIVDYKRLQPQLANRLVTNPPYRSQRSFGSVALDWCWLAAGRGHVYVHGKQNLWDFAAGQLIFNEAGGYSSTLEGEPVFNNKLEKRSAK